jgi:hypothetical protein
VRAGNGERENGRTGERENGTPESYLIADSR